MKTALSKGKTKRGIPKDKPDEGPVPDVIVDFVFDTGCLFISIMNIGRASAHKVRIKFSHPIYHVDGKTMITTLPLFRALEFLPPSKEIRTFVDSTASYFRRNQPEKLSVRISCTDEIGRKHERTIAHNLSIYKKIAFIEKSDVGKD